MMKMGDSSKFNAERTLLTELHGQGRESASTWLDQHFDDVGERLTVICVQCSKELVPMAITADTFSAILPISMKDGFGRH